MSFDFKRALQKEVNVGLKEQKIRYWAGSAALLLSLFILQIPPVVRWRHIDLHGFFPLVSSLFRLEQDDGRSQ